MSTQGANAFSRLDVPDLDGGVVRPCRQDIVIKLQAGDAVLVALERPDRTPSRLPVVSDFVAVPVHVLPGSKLSLFIELRSAVDG